MFSHCQHAKVSQFDCCAETGVGKHSLTEQQNTQQSKALKSLLILWTISQLHYLLNSTVRLLFCQVNIWWFHSRANKEISCRVIILMNPLTNKSWNTSGILMFVLQCKHLGLPLLWRSTSQFVIWSIPSCWGLCKQLDQTKRNAIVYWNKLH